MAENPTPFTVELTAVHTAGAVDMPALAGMFATAITGVHNSAWNDSRPFGYNGAQEAEPVEVEILGQTVESSAGPGYDLDAGEAMGHAYAPWAELRNLLHAVLFKSAGIVLEAGDALVCIAASYAVSDTDTQTAIARIPVAADPPLVGVGDPHETTTVTVDPDVPFVPSYEVEVLDVD